jgi:adenylosuccinate synthase
LEKVEVEYETMPGWKTSIASCRKFSDLPENAQKYIKRIEQLLKVKVEWIGVGPGREAMIKL